MVVELVRKERENERRTEKEEKEEIGEVKKISPLDVDELYSIVLKVSPSLPKYFVFYMSSKFIKQSNLTLSLSQTPLTISESEPISSSTSLPPSTPLPSSASEYERKRLEALRQNLEQLRSIGLDSRQFTALLSSAEVETPKRKQRVRETRKEMRKL